MTVNYRDLCSTIVEDCYGDFYGLLFRRLAQHGRLSASQLAQKCHLPLRHAKAGLAALIQLGLALFHESPIQDFATYQANLHNAYNIIRIGKLVNLAIRNLGDDAGSLMRTACDLGFTSVAELKARTNDRLINKGSAHELDRRMNDIIQQLLENSFCVRVRSAHFQSMYDAQNDVEQFLKDAGSFPKTTGAKAKAELEARIESELRSRLTTTTSEVGHVNKSFRTKIGLNGCEHPESDHNSKGLSNGDVKFEGLLVRPNFQKLVATKRSEYLHDIAEERISHLSGAVLRALVDQTEAEDTWQIRTDPIHQANLDDILEDVNDRVSGIVTDNAKLNQLKMNGTHRHTLSVRDIDRNLKLLSESSFDFLNGGSNLGTWIVDRQELQSFVQRREILRLIESRVQSPSPRILRMLIDKGKIEEKALQEIGLLGAKELRQSLAQLKKMGYVDLQEVPRDPQRQPNRTLFLWFHDSERVQQTILESIYTTMIRLLQRLKIERQVLSGTLNKIEREDVEGKLEQILPAAELDTLTRFRRIEAWFLVELSRLDDSVSILRGN